MNKLHAVIAFVIGSFCAQAQVVPVKVISSSEGYYLQRDGKPFYIKGAGGHRHLAELKECRGNSIRTWSAENALSILDAAQEKGLTVMMGLWVAHERHGFDYDDTAAVARQLEKFTKTVHRLKDHPALLLWAVGNEVDLAYSNPRVWNAIQDIAAMIHRVDSAHPTTTVTAGIDSSEVAYIMQRAPDIDILSINTYGDIAEVPQEVKRFGWTGPYMITEWGPNGHWEVDTTSWGAPLEQTSTEKASVYRSRYQNYIADHPDQLGSYVFLWGQKQETTSTWYGLFSPNGKPTEAITVLSELWGGAKWSSSAGIQQMTLSGAQLGADLKLKPDSLVQAEIKVLRSSDDLNYRWELKPESQVVSAGGDYEDPLPSLALPQARKAGSELTFKTPKDPGAYRLFVFVENREGVVSYANFPFLVSSQPRSTH